MAETWGYRGQEITSEQITLLREFIGAHSTSSRWKLSRQLCEEWGWKQPNGALRDVVCRGLLLMLERGRADRVTAGALADPGPVSDPATAARGVAGRHCAASDDDRGAGLD